MSKVRSISNSSTSSVPSIVVNNSNDHNVPQAGSDGISSLAFSPRSNHLVSTNWDGTVRYWECKETGGQVKALPQKISTHDEITPVFSAVFSDDGRKIISGGVDKRVYMWDLNSFPCSSGQDIFKIGHHSAPVKSVAYLASSNLVVSGGWDKMLKFWDSRHTSTRAVQQIELPGRVYDLDVQEGLMAVATSDNQLILYDVSGRGCRLADEHSRLQSPVKSQTRCVRCYSDMSGFAVGGIGGEISLQSIRSVAKKEIVSPIKCHRRGADAFSVNSISFNPVFETFATAGSDGLINFWDKKQRVCMSKLWLSNKPISCIAFNAKGNMLAYACSYDWGKGSHFYVRGEPNEIFLHYPVENEVSLTMRNQDHKIR